MFSPTRHETVLKLLATAAHVQTNAHEAVNALQAAVRMLDRDGYALSDLRLADADDFNHAEGEPAAPVLDMIRQIASLEADIIARIRNEDRLTTENSSLKAELKKLQSAPRLLASQRENLMDTIANPMPNSTPEEIAERRDEKRDERIAKGKAARAARAPRTVKATDKPAKAQRGFRWSDYPEQYDRMVAMYLAGTGKVLITKELGIENLNAAQVHAATANGRPPASLNVQVRESGPIDWAEAWLIGSTLFWKKRSWLGPTLEALGLPQAPSKGLSFDLNQHVSVENIDALRKRFNDRTQQGANPPKLADEHQADEQQPEEEQADDQTDAESEDKQQAA